VSLLASHEPVGWFAIRLPLLPLRILTDWLSADAEGWKSEDRSQARQASIQALRSIVERPEVLEALYVASPSLAAAIPKWLQNPDSRDGRRSETALGRYVARMCARATPFGLFAGVALGEVSDTTQLRVAERSLWRRKVRLDGSLLARTCEAIATLPAARNTIRYHPNSTLYYVGGRARYVATTFLNGEPEHRLSAVDRVEALDRALQRSSGGAQLAEICSGLIEDGADPAEAQAFVQQLIEHRLLVPELEPILTGGDSLALVAKQLESRQALQREAGIIQDTLEQLGQINSAPLGIPSTAYDQITSSLEPLVSGGRYAYQVDLAAAVDASLQRSVAAEAMHVIDKLRPLHLGPHDPDKEQLARFRSQFKERYDGREVLLAEALDEELGIGFGAVDPVAAEESVLLDGVHVPVWKEPTEAPLREVQLRLVEQAMRNRTTEVAFEPTKVTNHQDAEEYPDTFSLNIAIAAKSDAAVARGEYRITLFAVDGPPGGRLLGRMCSFVDGLEPRLRDFLRIEELKRQDAIFAEVVHVPHDRVGNVAHRPLLRSFEIPWGGRSGAEAEHQINLSDLSLQLVGERIVLRSQKLGREIIPRLTTAHYYGHPRNLPVYRFLGALQRQDTPLIPVWWWGALEASAFLPRVVVGRVVISRARWRLGVDDVRAFCAGADSSARIAVAQRWRTERDVPRLVTVGEADRQLIIDLESPMSLAVLASVVTPDSPVALTEVYPGPDELLACGPDGHYTHEIIIPFARRADAGDLPGRPQPQPPIAIARRARPQSRYSLGSEWLYAKVYAGSGSLDRLLYRIVPPLLEHGSCVDRWFFIRYGDPDWHLRLRLHGEPTRLVSEIVPRLSRELDTLVDAGWASRIAYESYEPESERYGGDAGRELAERYFHADSEMVLDLLSVARGVLHPDDRWRLAVRSVASLLSDLQIAIPECQRLMVVAHKEIAAELGLRNELRRALGHKYRALRHVVDSIVDGRSGEPGSPDPREEACFSRRAHRNRELLPPFHRMLEAGSLMVSTERYITSLVHMTLNRILRWAHLPQEMVVYDLLCRGYASAPHRMAKDQAT